MEKENAVQGEIKPSGAMPSGFYNMDCMEAMKRFPDKFFDLAIVDPPYGDALDGTGGGVQPVRRSLQQVQTDGSASARGSTGTSWTRFNLAGRQARYARIGGGRPFANRWNLGR